MKQLTKTQNAIGLLVLFCISLILFRALYTQSLFFGFLLWNMVLAIIPYGISQWIITKYPNKIKLYTLLVVWLLFLPNAPYLITDIVHLHHTKSSLLWYDIFMLFSFANTGLLLAIFSINDIYKFIKEKFNSQKATYTISIVIMLCGFGIYLGRFLRFNSWDLFTNPLLVIQQSINCLTNTTTWLITIGFACLLWIIFSIFQNLREIKH